MITTEATIADKKEDKPANDMAGGMPGGMPGMGGMGGMM
jgi:chaperonin GroEL